MSDEDAAKLDVLLRRHGLIQCPHCQAPITASNLGWNSAPDFDDVFPIVFVACKRCQNRLKVFQIKAFAQSLDDAIEALKNA